MPGQRRAGSVSSARVTVTASESDSEPGASESVTPGTGPARNAVFPAGSIVPLSVGKIVKLLSVEKKFSLGGLQPAFGF